MSLPELLLASASPRRRELLSALQVNFAVEPAHIDESVHAGESPADYVRRMAIGKAAKVAAAVDGDRLVLGADTAVVIDRQILGKPVDRTDALRMLQMLSGRSHEVISAVAVANAADMDFRMSRTIVTFRPLTSAELQAYWDTGEPRDKAGGYAIQGLGGAFVRQIIGSYSGVVGLPMYETAELLRLYGLTVPTHADD